jgi:serine/threonine protein kinase
VIAKGQKINDRYEIEKLIGEGGMANVYLARDTILDRKVAVKVLRGDLAGDEKFVRRFQREALSASSLSHPNIVEIYDVGEDDGNFYIVMEYIEGKTLKQLIKKRGVLSLSETMDIMLQLLDALATAHDSYIIHRDIKPQNIMIKESGLVKITDFGIAMALNNAQLTQTNSVMGSVHYLPPEQASGKGSTIRSDIYSLGILMFEMLTGKMPFKGDTAVEIALKHMKEPLPSVRALNPVVPQSVENIILKAAAKNPKNRYRDVRQMADDIKTCLDADRENEQKIVFKYPETDFSDTKTVNVLKEEKKEVKEDKPVAKQITEDDKIEKSNKKKITIISVIIGVFVLVMVLAIIVLPKITESEEVRVPDVYGMEISEAEDMIKDAGFSVQTEKRSSDEVDENLVIETDPEKNRYVKKGSTITIYYSSGSKKIEVDNYVGQNVYEVKARLELDGIEVVIEEKEVTDSSSYEGKEQLIIEQSVSAGEKLSSGERITLYIPKILSTYPDMVTDGWTLQRATEFCEKYGLTLKVTYKGTNDVEENIVLAQSPKAGEEVFENDVFTIVVSQRQSTTTTTTSTTEDSGDALGE